MFTSAVAAFHCSGSQFFYGDNLDMLVHRSLEWPHRISAISACNSAAEQWETECCHPLTESDLKPISGERKSPPLQQGCPCTARITCLFRSMGPGLAVLLIWSSSSLLRFSNAVLQHPHIQCRAMWKDQQDTRA